MRVSPFVVRAVFVVLAFISSILVAVIAGVLSHANGTRVPGAVLYGGGAFVGWMTLSLMALEALGWLDVGSSGDSSTSRQNVDG